MKKYVLLVLLLGIHSLLWSQNYTFQLQDQLVFEGQKTKLEIYSSDIANNSTRITINEVNQIVHFKNGRGEVDFIPSSEIITINIDATQQELTIRIISPWWSIIPPLLAILFALIFQEVIISLVIGIFSGAFIYVGFGFENILVALSSIFEHYIIPSLYNTGHLSVILFSLTIGGMVAVISKNGGMAGVVNVLSNYAKSSRSSQLVTWILGILVFFDDYANTLVVGNTMRPVTDKFNVSREKLAYIVDSTAAPVASIAFVTTWIGAQLGYINDARLSIGIEEGAYSIFINSLQYAFYPILTLFFMFFIIYFKKDFGPMYKAEVKSKSLELTTKTVVESEELKKLNPKENTKINYWNALLPVLTVIIVTIIGLLITGKENSLTLLNEKGIVCDNSLIAVWQNLNHIAETNSISFFRKLGIIIGNSDSYIALLWSSFFGLLIAIVMSVVQRILTLKESIESMIDGIKTMLPAIIVLILAWSLALITEHLHTADFLTSLFSDKISPYWIPAITFILAAIVSFSTGSSWGTMAILYPLMIPATWSIASNSGLSQEETMQLIYNVVSVVLAGSVFGDHCSPISDTTILSSLASQCDHISHVKTQLPYAITVGSVSIFIALVLVNLGIPWYFNYLIGIGILYGIVRFFGKNIVA